LTHSVVGQGVDTLPSSARSTLNFDADWKFFKGDAKGAEAPGFDDSQWETVNLPHDWQIEGPLAKDNPSGTEGGFFPLGVGWYRKHFTLKPESRSQTVFIQFDGIHKSSDVWINGHHLGNRWYGYVSFQYDLTAHLNPEGPNVLTVRVDNSEQTSRWYTGSGIYRHVWLTLTNPVHIAHWGTYVTTTDISQKSARVRVRTDVKNERSGPSVCNLKTEILGPEGKMVATVSSGTEIGSGRSGIFDQELVVESPALWSVDSPTLYRARVTVSQENQVVDATETLFGIRSIAWHPERGLLVNGEPVKMKGVCLHHDLGALGAAFVDRAAERRLEILKSMGCNAIRMAHNPPAPQLLDMCDRLGFLVIDEAFDKWSGRLSPHFERDWQMDLASMIQRDWNHPSVVLWSVGNEVGEQTSEKGSKILKRLTDFAHGLDPSRRVTCAAFPRLSFDFVKATDIISLNYQEQWFDQYRQASPRGVILSAEAYPYYSGKGDSHKNFNPVNPYLKILEKDYYVGSFVWTGIDYLGEAVAGWPFHGWNCSLLDTCGFQRPISYFHQSVWSDEPMVHIAVLHDSVDVPEPVKDHWGWPRMVSHWTLPDLEGQELKIVTFTNCETVELIINGRSLGVQKLADYDDRMMVWKAPYAAGTIKAVGRKAGREPCAYELKTAGKPAQILLLPDRPTIKADGQDIAHFEVRILDDQGNLIPDAARPIEFAVSGPAKIVGLDNGDMTSSESYQGKTRQVFHGRALALVQSDRVPGDIHLTAGSAGLASTTATIRSE
jgi:beta-galactosidase